MPSEWTPYITVLGTRQVGRFCPTWGQKFLNQLAWLYVGQYAPLLRPIPVWYMGTSRCSRVLFLSDYIIILLIDWSFFILRNNFNLVHQTFPSCGLETRLGRVLANGDLWPQPRPNPDSWFRTLLATGGSACEGLVIVWKWCFFFHPGSGLCHCVWSVVEWHWHHCVCFDAMAMIVPVVSKIFIENGCHGMVLFWACSCSSLPPVIGVYQTNTSGSSCHMPAVSTQLVMIIDTVGNDHL